MADSNAQQIIDWNGKNGATWVANQDRLDRMLAACGEAALDAAAVRSGEAVLDIGCGAGATSLDLARRVSPTGRCVGVDISRALVDRARARAEAEGLAIDFQLADASQAAFPPQRFDLLFSRFGVMFFDDPTAAFANLRAALKHTGRLAFICWRGPKENDWVKLPIEATRGILPPQPPQNPEAPGPFSFGDADRIRRILQDAGFADIGIAPFDTPLVFGVGASGDAAVDDALDQASQVGPLARLLADQPSDLREQALAAVRKAFAERLESNRVVISGAAWIVTASASASDHA